MTSIINTVPNPPAPVVVDFSWTTTGPVVSYTIDGYTYVAGVNAAILFVAVPFDATDSGAHGYPKVIPPPGVTILQYRWDFDDGTIAFGPRPTHTFVAAPNDLQVTLTVLDSRHLQWSTSHTLTIVAGLTGSSIAGFKIRS